MSVKEDSQYFYIKSDPDHYDLEDLFNGQYISSRKEWRFDKNKTKEEDVVRFLDCSSCESEEDNFNDNDDENVLQSSDTEKDVEVKRRLRDRLHRANSFNASDSSDEDNESIDGDYRRQRPSERKIKADVNKLNKEISKMNENKPSQNKQSK